MPPHPDNVPVPGPSTLPGGFDYETTTRREFTNKLCNVPAPDLPKPAWTELSTVLQDLTRALADHEPMAPNIDQPHGQPANRKTKVYHMWDSVGRTLSMTLALNMTLPRREKGFGMRWWGGRGMRRG